MSAMKVDKRLIDQIFIDHGNHYFSLRCMLELGSTSFIISPEAVKPFRIPVVMGIRKDKSADATGREIATEELFTIPLGISFGNHHLYNEDDHAFEVMKTSADYVCIIPAW